MTIDSKLLASVLVDEALVCAMIPWACPCSFGPGGRYLLQEIVCIGPRSLVYKAVDQQLSSEGFEAVVIIKIANRQGSGAIDARSARRVEHPNVVRVLEFGIEPESGAEYVVSEYIAGGDLAAAPVPMPPRRAATIVAKLAQAVQAAHASGVVHCDLKPANVLMTADGEPKLADFDLCRSPLAQDGTARGNEAFMSPEQRQGGELGLTPLADVFALGGILRWLVTGCLPSEPSQLTLDGDLQAIIDRAMEPDWQRRRDCAGSLAQDLDDWLSWRPLQWRRTGVTRRALLWTRRKPGLAALAAAGAIVLAGAGVFQWQRIATARAERDRANAAIVRGLEEKIADLQKRGGAIIQGLYSSFGSGGAMSVDRAFNQAYVIEFLRGSQLVDEAGRDAGDLKRLAIFQSIVEYADVELAPGAGETSEMMLARFALAHLLIDTGHSEQAGPHVEKLKAWWGSRLDAKDPLMRGIGLMEVCVQAEASPSDDRIKRISELIEQAADDRACEASRRLAGRVLKRFAINPRGSTDRDRQD